MTATVFPITWQFLCIFKETYFYKQSKRHLRMPFDLLLKYKGRAFQCDLTILLLHTTKNIHYNKDFNFNGCNP